MLQSLVFDLGGVIMDHNIPGTIAKFQVLMGDNISLLGLQPNGEAAGMDKSEQKRLQAAISNAAQTSSIMHEYELGYASTADFVKAILPLCKIGTTAADILDAWDTMHAGIPSYRIDMLCEWRKTHRIYALSNNNEEHWHDVHSRYPEFDSWFDASFASHLLHIGKPDVRIFEAAEKHIAADYPEGEYHREDTIFIDDLASNREAARAFGWQACGSVEELDALLKEKA